MKSLTTKELDAILKRNSVTKRYFLGTFPACIYPESNRNIYSFITNTDAHDERGEHWNSWFVIKDKITFFDSFGRPPDDPSLPQHYRDIMKKFKVIEFNRSQIQGLMSKTCGYFCIHFIYDFSLGLNFESFLDEYYINFEINDIVVRDIVNSLN